IVGAPEANVYGKRTGLIVPGPVTLKIVVRFDHVFAFVAGELVAEFRRPSLTEMGSTVKLAAYGGEAILDGLHAESLVPFAGYHKRPDTSGYREINLPGIPPATGLRAQYWSAAPQWARYTTLAGRQARLWPLLGEPEPVTDTVVGNL